MLVAKIVKPIVAATLMNAGLVHAASISTAVTNGAGAPLVDVIVYAEPVGGKQVFKQQPIAEIEQRERKFVPHVSVVQTGTAVLFPNQDSVRHHVYSFSPAKSFELKLYTGVPSSPITFDKAGTVTVGCNIHDKMIAYVHVVNTSHFGKTDATGRVRLDDLPAGDYVLKAWHYGLPAAAQIVEQRLKIGTASATAAFTLNLPGLPQ